MATNKVSGTAKADVIVIAKNYATVNGKKTSIAGNGVTVKAGKKNDSITIKSGGTTKAPNNLYGEAGNDIFVIEKNSTGIAVVQDFSTKKGNKDSVIVNGNTSNISVSGKNMIIKGGKSGKASLTLKNAKGKTFTVTDSRGSYTVKSSNVALTLTKYYKGTLTAPSFITTIDARELELEKNSYGADIQRDVNVTGNTKANTIYVAKINGGTYQGGKGKDTIIVSAGDNHIIYGDDKAGKITGKNSLNKDTIIINGGTGHTIYGGTGADTITVEKGIENCKYSISGGDGNDVINLNSGGGYYDRPTVSGGKGSDKIYLYSTVKDYFTVNGGNDGDTIEIYGGSHHVINGDSGTDHITLFEGAGSNIMVNGGKDKDYINAEAGSGTLNGDAGDDEITVSKKAGAFAINGGNGADTITVDVNSYSGINGGKGKDIITLTDVVGNGSQDQKIYGWEGDDEITVNGGNNHWIYGDDQDGTYNGTDTITVNTGSGHRIDAGGGNNIVELNDSSSTVYCGGGNDTITVNSGNHTLNGGNGLNTFTINDGTNTINGGIDKDIIVINGGYAPAVNAGDGKDQITLAGGTGKRNDSNCVIDSGSDDDIIQITGGDGYRVNSGKGKDEITIRAGSHRISNLNNGGGEDGDDIIKIIDGAGDGIEIIGGDFGAETVEIYAGDSHTVSLGNQNNTVLVDYGTKHNITTGEHVDRITVQNNAHVSNIVTGKGDDIITIKDGAHVNNNNNSRDYRSIRAGEGSDRITIEATAGDKTEVNAESGNDLIYVYGGNEHSIFTGSGDDKIKITAGEKHYIELGSDSNDLEIAVEATSRTSKTTINATSQSSDFITINWSKGENNGIYQIDSRYGQTGLYDDKLTIIGASASDFDFYISGGDYKQLQLSSDDGNIMINSWVTPQGGVAAFSRYGITFINDGTKQTLSYEEINNTYLS